MKHCETMNKKLSCRVRKIWYSLNKTKGTELLRKVVKTKTQYKDSPKYRKHESSRKVM